VSAPWWEDSLQIAHLIDEYWLPKASVSRSVKLVDLVRGAARKAVETHGHARGCVCHLECKHPTDQACGDRDPRCLSGAK
jgi:hypothetical protein